MFKLWIIKIIKSPTFKTLGLVVLNAASEALIRYAKATVTVLLKQDSNNTPKEK